MSTAECKEVILARGHPNISATHRTTLEITKQEHLSNRGNCVIAVKANKALDDLNPDFKKDLRKDRARITILVEAGGLTETLIARGSSRLILCNPTDIVVRRSDYVCSRTLAIQANKAARDLSRELVNKLRNSEQDVTITVAIGV